MAKFFRFPFAVSGDKTAIPETIQPSGTVSYEEGFGADYQKTLGVDPDAKPIPRDQSNELYYDITNALRQYQTEGAPDWITAAENGGVAFPYAKFAIVRYDDGSGPGFKVYMSLTTANVSTPSVAGVPSVNWRIVSDPEVPIGAILDFGSDVFTPAGFLNCDGSAVSRTTYSLLFAAIGTAWGVGDGSTTFNIPDFRRRTAVGFGGSGTGVLGDIVGSVGGVEAEVIVQANLPSGFLTGAEISGTHLATPNTGADIDGVGPPIGSGGVSVNTDIDLGGSNTPLNIMQPSAVVQKIIKYR